MASIRRKPGVPEAIVLAALLLSACAGPSLPLLSPVEQAKYYGYAEQPLGDNRYAVSYLGPSHLALSYWSARDQASEAARIQAYDFALWRAALIAQTAGYGGLRVTSRQADVDTIAQPAYYDSGFYAPFGPGSDMFHHGHPFGSAYDAGYYYPPSPYARIQARARIDVELVHEPGPGDLKVQEVLGRLQQAYPGADKLPPEG